MAGSLTIHYGLMGSGKTLFAMADVVIPAVKAGRPFFTNITGVNLSAISWISGVHSSLIKYYPVNDIHDVIGYFDNSAVSHDGIFVLDEMKDFIDNEKAISWLESRVNVCRKQGVDFLFIAQQNKKQYIHPDLIGLCDTCNYFSSRKQNRDTSHVDEYFIQGGDPKVVNKIPLVYDGVTRRKKDPRVFLTYSTSDSKYYNADEDNTYKGLFWYQTRRWKLRFILIFVVVVALVIVAYIIKSLFGAVDDLDTKKVKEVGNEVEKVVQSVSSGEGVLPNFDNTPSCYTWKICNGRFCETDVGTFPAVNDIDGSLCVGSRCYRPCETGHGFSSRRGLLQSGEQVPKGKEPSLHSKR